MRCRSGGAKFDYVVMFCVNSANALIRSHSFLYLDHHQAIYILVFFSFVFSTFAFIFLIMDKPITDHRVYTSTISFFQYVEYKITDVTANYNTTAGKTF